MVNSVC